MLALKIVFMAFCWNKNTKQIAHYDYNNYEENHTSVNKIGWDFVA